MSVILWIVAFVMCVVHGLLTILAAEPTVAWFLVLATVDFLLYVAFATHYRLWQWRR